MKDFAQLIHLVPIWYLRNGAKIKIYEGLPCHQKRCHSFALYDAVLLATQVPPATNCLDLWEHLHMYKTREQFVNCMNVYYITNQCVFLCLSTNV